MDHRPWPVILLPGSIMPAAPAYSALLAELGTDVDARIKDLELYATPTPAPAWSLAAEVDGITRLADEARFERFHLVGYSGGGASSLAFVVRHPDRLLSLSLLEPAFAGWHGMTPVERTHFERFLGIADLPDPEQMAAFQALQLAPGVEHAAPPAGPAPAWMAQRPAGVRALLAAFFESDFDPETLGRSDRSVLFVLGGRSHPDYFARMAERLAGVFPDFTLEVFQDRHHFDPPHRTEPALVAALLRSLWSRAKGTPRPITSGA